MTDDQQWICETPGECRCTGTDTCDCMSEPNIAGNCDCCGAPMILINVDSGEPVKAATA